MVTLVGVPTFCCPGRGLQEYSVVSMHGRHILYKHKNGIHLVFTVKCTACPASGHGTSVSSGRTICPPLSVHKVCMWMTPTCGFWVGYMPRCSLSEPHRLMQG